MSVIPDSIIVLPSLDLKDGGSLEQALSNLTQLEHQFSKLCSNLDQRLANLKGKLGNINQRVGTSRQKIDTLKEINEAITIVSPAKFVKVYKKGQDSVFHQVANPDFVNNQKVPLFNYQNTMNLNTNIKPIDNIASAPAQRLSVSHHDDELRKIMKLTRGSLKPKRELFSGAQAIQNQKYEGLGRIPRDIRFIDSLVVFNSKQNPYQKYSSFDNLLSNSQINIPRKRNQKDKDKINLQEAPKTLMEGDVIQQFGQEDHRFRPEARELPQLVAPSQLGLQGIVNINFNNFDFDPLAPSKGGTVNRPTIPDPKFVEEQQTNLINPSLLSMQRFSNAAPSNDNHNNNTLAPVNMTQSQAPSNNFAYSPVISQNRTVNVQVNPQLSASTASQPRPANNPPIQQQQQQATPGPIVSAPQANNKPPGPTPTQPAGSPQKQSKPMPPKATSARNALLDEIRNPKVKLKKATKTEDKPPMERKAGAKAEPAMSHMDHLKQQIQLRFQALNKNKEKEVVSDDEDD